MRTKDIQVGQAYAEGSTEYTRRNPRLVVVTAVNVTLPGAYRQPTRHGMVKTTRLNWDGRELTDYCRPADILMLWSDWEVENVRIAELEQERAAKKAAYRTNVENNLGKLGISGYLEREYGSHVTISVSDLSKLVAKFEELQK